MHIPKVLLALLLLCLALPGYGQTDSLTIFLIVNGPKREKLDIYYKGQHVISAPRGGAFVGSCKIPAPQAKSLDLFMTRAQLFGLFSKDVSLGIGYDPRYKDDPSHKYLVIERDPYRKNRHGLTFHWADKEPTLALCGWRRWHFL